MTALAMPAGRTARIDRRVVAAGACFLFALIDIVGFGLYAKHGDAEFVFSTEFAKVAIPNLGLPAAATAFVCGGITVAVGLLRGLVPLGAVARRVCIGVVLFAFVLALLCWADAGQSNPLSVINLLQGTLASSIPLILGALAG